METLKTYIDNMFMNLPETEQVKKAKEELYQMMEDKYSELISQGKQQHEALGIVISEFGNLDDMKEALGLNASQNATQNEENGNFNATKNEKIEKICVNKEEFSNFFSAINKKSLFIALGVAFCILSVAFPIIFSSFSGTNIAISDALGVCLMFASIATGVVLIIIGANTLKTQEKIYNSVLELDSTCNEYLENERKKVQSKNIVFLAVGIALCILSIVPTIYAGALEENAELSINLSSDAFKGSEPIASLHNFSQISASSIFILCAIGVFLIVYSANRTGSFNMLKESIMQNISFAKRLKKEDFDPDGYTNKTAASVMAVFWPTITCIYLAYSFLTANWHISWIIWPVAGVINLFLDNLFKK